MPIVAEVTIAVVLIALTIALVMSIYRRIRSRPIVRNRIYYEIAETVQTLLFEEFPPHLKEQGGLRLDGHDWTIVVVFTNLADLKLIPRERNGVKIIPQLTQAAPA